MKILIVEDNTRMRAFIRKMFERNIENVESIYEYDDGDEAITLYQKYHPDWVLMDIQLKTMDGLTAAKMIMISDSSAKIIFVTQYDDAEYRKMAKDIGVNDYVIKDSLSDLVQIIKSQL